jgi:hypothetical protein
VLQFPRYAIYYLPAADSALYRFGAEMLGYDAFSGEMRSHPTATLLTFPDWPALTEEPRKYGFHATLKAPFSLADGAREQALLDTLHQFASAPREIPVIAPVVHLMGDFIAVVPFEQFRAPITPQDRARRLKSPLTPRQIAHVDRFGYPYVFEDFRFHMTLTGRVPTGKRDDVLAYLRARFAQLAIHRLAVGAIALLRQAAPDRRFEVLTRLHLAGRINTA